MASQNKTTAEERTMAQVRPLCTEIADLKEKLAEIHRLSDVDFAARDPHPWLRIAATVSVTFAPASHLRLGFRMIEVSPATPMVAGA